jgi:fatty acid desaturase
MNLSEQLKALRQPNFLRSSLGLLGDWILIIGTLWTVHHLHHLATYILGAYLVGIYQQRLGVMGHEAVHHVLAKNRRVNIWVGNVFCFWPVGTSVLGYRHFHFMHHKYTNTPYDPEMRHKKNGAWEIPTTIRKMIVYMTRDMLGLSVKDLLMMTRLTIPPTWKSGMGPLLMAVLFIGASVATGNYWLPLVWYGGTYTTFWASLRVRIWFEHIGAMDTHRVHFPWWARWLISPHNIWVHWEHHKYSSVPYWNLLKVRALEPNPPVLEITDLLRQFLGRPATPPIQVGIPTTP